MITVDEIFCLELRISPAEIAIDFFLKITVNWMFS